jgi:hypothetical protein
LKALTRRHPPSAILQQGSGGGLLTWSFFAVGATVHRSAPWLRHTIWIMVGGAGAQGRIFGNLPRCSDQACRADTQLGCPIATQKE